MYSHSEGGGTSASGDNSHAEGGGTIASGAQSHAEGQSTISASPNQHVQGKYNVEDTESKYAFIIGNGTSNDNRSNAIAIDWDGNILCYGDEISINEQIDNNTRKLSGIDDNANNYIHPTHTSHSKSMYKFANDEFGHVSDAEEVTKQDIVDLGIPGSIPIYNVDVDEEYGYSEGMIIATIVVNQTAHPIGVPIIGENENADYGLMSASDKTKLDGISDNANNYVHPTTSGNKHIPSGGSSGQILRWLEDGTAIWGEENDTEVESISNIDLENMLK